MLAVYKIWWEESEQGWGTRGDGYSLHATKEEADQYVKDYWTSMPNEVQEEYSRPCTDPTLEEVDEKLHEEVQKKRNIRKY